MRPAWTLAGRTLAGGEVTAALASGAYLSRFC